MNYDLSLELTKLYLTIIFPIFNVQMHHCVTAASMGSLARLHQLHNDKTCTYAFRVSTTDKSHN